MTLRKCLLKISTIDLLNIIVTHHLQMHSDIFSQDYRLQLVPSPLNSGTACSLSPSCCAKQEGSYPEIFIHDPPDVANIQFYLETSFRLCNHGLWNISFQFSEARAKEKLQHFHSLINSETAYFRFLWRIN